MKVKLSSFGPFCLRADEGVSEKFGEESSENQKN